MKKTLMLLSFLATALSLEALPFFGTATNPPPPTVNPAYSNTVPTGPANHSSLFPPPTVQTGVPSTAAPATIATAFNALSQPRVLFLGDSYSDPGGTYPSAPGTMFDFFVNRIGLAGGSGTSWKPNGNAAFSNPLPAGVYWFCNLTVSQYPNNDALLQAQQGAANNQFRTLLPTNNLNSVGLYWLAYPGGGNFCMTNTRSGFVTNWTLSGYAASVTLRHTNFTASGSDNTLLFKTLTGTNVFICPEMLSASNGIIANWQARGGGSLGNMTNSGLADLQAMAQAFQPDFLVYDAMDVGENGNNAAQNRALLSQVIDSFTTTKTRVIVLGEIRASSVNVADLAAWNIEQKALCQSRGWTYVDLPYAFPSATANDNNGLIADALHPTIPGAKAFSGTALSSLGFVSAAPAMVYDQTSYLLKNALTNNQAGPISLMTSNRINSLQPTLILDSPNVSNGVPILQFHGTWNGFSNSVTPGNIAGADLGLVFWPREEFFGTPWPAGVAILTVSIDGVVINGAGYGGGGGGSALTIKPGTLIDSLQVLDAGGDTQAGYDPSGRTYFNSNSFVLHDFTNGMQLNRVYLTMSNGILVTCFMSNSIAVIKPVSQ